MSVRSRVREEIGLLQRMRRRPGRGWIAGVCAGLADFFDWNVRVIRLLFIVGFVFGGFFPAGLLYLVLWYLMEPEYGAASRAAQSDSESSSRHRRHRHRHWRVDGSDDGEAEERPARSNPTELKVRFARLEERLRNMEACVASNEFELRRELRKLES